MAQKPNKIDFIKTFVKTCEVMIKNLEIEEVEDIKFWKISKTVAQLYPALKNAAWEFNQECDAHIEIPENTPKDTFSKAEAFCHLYQKISDELSENQPYLDAEFLFDVSNLDFGKKVFETSQCLQENQNDYNCYWTYNSLTLAAAFTEEMKDELYSKMKNEFLDVQLAEKLISTLVKRGVIKDTSNIEEVRLVLADVGELFAENPNFITEAEISHEMVEQFQVRCFWDGKNKTVQNTVSEYIENFSSIVAKNRPDFFKYYTNHNLAVENFDALPIAMTDEYYAELANIRYLNKTLGIKDSIFNYDASANLDNIFGNIDSLSDVGEMKIDSKVNPLEEHWNDYQFLEQMDGDLRDEFERVLSQWVTIADSDLSETIESLQLLEDKSIDRNDDDDDDDDDESSHFYGRDDFRESEEDMESKRRVVAYAREVLDISAAVKKYLDIELNDTPIDKKVIAEFKPDEKWNEFTFNSLNMLFSSFDKKLNENNSLILNIEDIELNPDAIDNLIALPSSLEKRNALLLFKFGLERIENVYIKNKNDIEADMVDDFTIFHQDNLATLVDELSLGQDVFADLDENTMMALAKDINSGVVVNFILPLYDDTESKENASDKVIDGINNYEFLTLETQRYVQGVAQRYSKNLLKAHNELLDKGDFDRDLFDWLEVHNHQEDDVNALALTKQKVNAEFEKEEVVYRNYRKFKKESDNKSYNKSVAIDILWQNWICNN